MKVFGISMGRAAGISGDFGINILASVIYTFARQIVVFPLLAARMSDADYGTLLTVAGLANIYIALTGNVLNNVRLMQNSRYEETGSRGDFNILVLGGCALSVPFALVVCKLFGCAAITAVLLAAYLAVSVAYQYASAFFRLELNFKRVFLSNVLVSLAYIMAASVLATGTLWPAIFLIGEGAGLVFTGIRTPMFREPLTRTPLLGETSRKVLLLVLTGMIGSVLMYADRMILYPLLDAESVSYYSVASFFGKSAGIVMTPIAGVLLGYFAQKNFKASKKLFMLINGISLACLGVFLLICLLLGPWVTRLLYPTLYEASAPYLFAANLAAVIGIAGNMAQPMVLKCCNTKWLLVIQGIYAAVYLAAALWLLPCYGLMGFCWASIIANTVRMLMLYLVGLWKFP